MNSLKWKVYWIVSASAMLMALGYGLYKGNKQAEKSSQVAKSICDNPAVLCMKPKDYVNMHDCRMTEIQETFVQFLCEEKLYVGVSYIRLKMQGNKIISTGREGLYE